MDRIPGGGRKAAPFVLAAAIAVVAGCAADPALTQRIHDLDETVKLQRQKNDEARALLSAAKKRAQAAEAENQRLQNRDAAFRDAQARLEARLKDLEGMGFPEAAAGADQDISLERLPGAGGFKFVVQGEVLFGSGSADPTAEGSAALAKIAKALSGRNERIRVEGHTDNVPIAKPETKAKFPHGNLDLSLQRALRAATVLVQEGVDARRVSCAGFGEHQPRADNGSADGKKRNRRVEILVQAD